MISLSVCFALFAVLFVPAKAELGTRASAKAMSEKAAALLAAEGPKALAAFQDKAGGFFDGDLYVFVLDTKGTFAAHGTKPVLIGKGSIEMKDANGFEFVKAFLAVKDKGWVEYRWPDPTDGGKVKTKDSYIVHTGEYWVGVGYYK